MRRIAVIGTTGAGKTIMARRIAERLSLPQIELDAFFWGPNWSETPREVFRERVDLALRGDAWVVDGNYSKVRDIVWGRADTLVWLDYPLWLIFWRLLRRTTGRVISGEALWNGNRESFRGAFLSRNSLFMWALQTYRRRRRDYPRLLQEPECAHLQLVRLRTPREATVWLSRVGAAEIVGGTQEWRR